ncbi:galactosylceramide sulfotransferase-like [Antedon mediterranea]|uniref:galactosylceramide sulfotransferase-like n=1 Tax=Antedon mediterranea TaxID=105859 RepID=UPI003AF7258A
MRRDPVYISILREPALQFESSFIFFYFGQFVPGRTHFRQMQEFFRKTKFYMSRITYDKLPYIHNSQFFDLGLDKKDFRNTGIVTTKIRKLDKEMDLILINEYYDESLVLLSKVLCWDLRDLVYLPINRRKKVKRSVLDSNLKQHIRNWNWADSQLYDYFLKRFKERIVEYGDSFKDDLATFKMLQSNFIKDCFQEVEKGKDQHDTNIQHVASNSRCNYFMNTSKLMNSRIEESMGIVRFERPDPNPPKSKWKKRKVTMEISTKWTD